MAIRVAVAAPAFPASLEAALLALDEQAAAAAGQGVSILCFPESYLPGYPDPALAPATASQSDLEAALERVRGIARQRSIALVVPMDWYEGGLLYNVAFVVNADGEILGYQTKNQLDPGEEGRWTPGGTQRVFDIPGLRFGIVICHEGFRYPESVRWMARQGAQLVFHPNCTGGNEGQQLVEWAHKSNPYYEKAQLVRALENTIYFAPSNYSFPAAHSASSIIAPDGSCLAWQAYGVPGFAAADIDLELATALLARRLRPEVHAVS